MSISLYLLANLVGVGSSFKSPLLYLWFLCPGVVVSLRAHELWGLGTIAGAWGVLLGFALVAMWVQVGPDGH
jgi:hypothetical protein